MYRVLAISIVLIFYAFAVSWATIINIPADYPTIQQGIDAGSDGDTVLVQPGTYVENINFNGHNVVLGSLFLTSGDTSYISQTVIDGDSSGSVVTFESGENSTAIITGFVVQNGLSMFSGGGISCRFADPTITGNHIMGNSAVGSQLTEGTGGGIGCFYSNALISHNIIRENMAIGFPTWTFGIGGALSFQSSSPIVINNIIIENSADHWGGGIYLYESNPIMVNNVLNRNIAGDSGGGIYCKLSSNPIIKNTIFWADSALYGAEINSDDSSSLFLTYCDIQGDWPGQGNIDLDPLFRDPDNSDFRLMSIACGDSADSPCIDAGDPNILDSLLDCSWGLGGTRSDMGAYGGGDSLVSAIFEEYIPIPGRFMLLQNYPNPFNASTTIRFVLQRSQDVELAIYDLLGRKVEALLDDYKQAGTYTITFHASRLSSGVYFYRLQAGEVVETRRMILLK